MKLVRAPAVGSGVRGARGSGLRGGSPLGVVRLRAGKHGSKLALGGLVCSLGTQTFKHSSHTKVLCKCKHKSALAFGPIEMAAYMLIVSKTGLPYSSNIWNIRL